MQPKKTKVSTMLAAGGRMRSSRFSIRIAQLMAQARKKKCRDASEDEPEPGKDS